MSADLYLQGILNREAVNTGLVSPVRAVQTTLAPTIQKWAGSYLLAVSPSGSFAKGTANLSGTDIDLFISLSETTKESLGEIYESLAKTVQSAGYTPRRQNVSIGVTVGSYRVDLVPAKRQGVFGGDHSLYRRKANTWTKTNVSTHVSTVIAGGRQQESRIIKLWRDQNGLTFPSFYVELAVIEALRGQQGTLSQKVWKVFEYLRDRIEIARFVDPSNTNNIISDDLTAAEKTLVKNAALRALAAADWNQIVV
jgi:hypothetical protein